MIPNLIGREVTLAALGRDWTFGRWTLAVWRDFLAWAKTVLPSPRDNALLFCTPGVDLQVQAGVVSAALEQLNGYLSIGSPAVEALMASPEGATKLMWLLLKPDASGGKPTEDDVLNLFLTLSKEQRADLFRHLQGQPPPPPPNGPAPAG